MAHAGDYLQIIYTVLHSPWLFLHVLFMAYTFSEIFFEKIRLKLDENGPTKQGPRAWVVWFKVWNHVPCEILILRVSVPCQNEKCGVMPACGA